MAVKMESETYPKDEASPQIDQVSTKAFGPAAGFLLAAGIGSLSLGIITLISEVNASFASSITYNNGVGPLSGKTIWAAAIYVVAAVVLPAVMWRRNPPASLVYWATGIMIAAGLVMTFPTVWQLFGA